MLPLKAVATLTIALCCLVSIVSGVVASTANSGQAPLNALHSHFLELHGTADDFCHTDHDDHPIDEDYLV